MLTQEGARDEERAAEISKFVQCLCIIGSRFVPLHLEVCILIEYQKDAAEGHRLRRLKDAPYGLRFASRHNRKGVSRPCNKHFLIMKTFRCDLQECPANGCVHTIYHKDHHNKRGYLKTDGPDIACDTYKTFVWSLRERYWYRFIRASKPRCFPALLGPASCPLNSLSRRSSHFLGSSCPECQMIPQRLPLRRWDQCNICGHRHTTK